MTGKEQMEELCKELREELRSGVIRGLGEGLARRKAGKDLGVLKDGSPVEPDFKNKEIAQNGIMSVQVKQQAIYMEQMKQQNKTLLNILATMANNQQDGSGNDIVVQPICITAINDRRRI